MRIGLDVAQTAAERAGCAWYADSLAKALVAAARPRGHDFVLYHQFGDWINGEPGHGTYLTGRDVAMPMFDLLPVRARTLWRAIEAGHEPLPGAPDVVIASSFHAPRLPGTQLVYVVHDLAFWTHPDFSTDATRLVCQRELGQALGRAAAWLFLSQSTQHDFETLFPGWLARSRRPHAIASGGSRWAKVTAPAPRPSHAPWLMVGSIEPRKNHACALDAYERYHAASPNPRPLRIVGGRGWHAEAIHARIAELNRRGLPVDYAGYLDDRALREVFTTAFALLQPSWHEGFGLPVLEAFTQGLPVIASDTASLPEVAGGAALHCPPDDPTAWATTMARLDIEPGLADDLAVKGLARADAYSWDGTAKTVLELIESLPLA